MYKKMGSTRVLKNWKSSAGGDWAKAVPAAKVAKVTKTRLSDMPARATGAGERDSPPAGRAKLAA